QQPLAEKDVASGQCEGVYQTWAGNIVEAIVELTPRLPGDSVAHRSEVSLNRVVLVAEAGMRKIILSHGIADAYLIAIGEARKTGGNAAPFPFSICQRAQHGFRTNVCLALLPLRIKERHAGDGEQRNENESALHR